MNMDTSLQAGYPTKPAPLHWLSLTTGVYERGDLYWPCHLAYIRGGNIGGTNQYIYAAATCFLWEGWGFKPVRLSYLR